MNSYYEKFSDGKVVCIDDEIPFEIPNGWEWCRLSNVIELLSGQDFIPEKYNSSNQGIPYITGASNIVNGNLAINRWTETPTVIGKLGDLLIVCKGSGVGKMCICNVDKIHIARQIQIIRNFSNAISLSYVKSVLEANLQTIISNAQGVIPGISREHILNLLIPLPPTNEQYEIDKILQEILPFINRYAKSQEALDKLNVELLGNLKNSILQEAVQGRLVQQIAEEGTGEELLEQIKLGKQQLIKEGKLKKSALTDSVIFRGDDNKYDEQIGSDIYDITDSIPFDIPANWNWCRLKDVCSIFTGATFKKEDASTGSKGVRVLRGGNISPFELVMKPDDLFLPCTKIKESILLRKNDIVTPAVTSLENIGKAARVQKDLNDVTVGGFVFILRLFLCNDWLSQYLLALLGSPSMGEYMKSVTNKSGQAFYNIGKERLAMAMIPLPPIKEQQRIVAQIEKLFEQLK